MANYKKTFKKYDRQIGQHPGAIGLRGPFMLVAAYDERFDADVRFVYAPEEQAQIENALFIENGTLDNFIILPMRNWANNNIKYAAPLPGEIWRCKVKRSKLFLDGGQPVILALPWGIQPTEEIPT